MQRNHPVYYQPTYLLFNSIEALYERRNIDPFIEQQAAGFPIHRSTEYTMLQMSRLGMHAQCKRTQFPGTPALFSWVDMHSKTSPMGVQTIQSKKFNAFRAYMQFFSSVSHWAEILGKFLSLLKMLIYILLFYFLHENLKS